jgi:competence protein ComEC
LIDAGVAMSAPAVESYLRQRGVRRIDAWFLTHNHPDHTGGVPHLAQKFPVGKVYHNGLDVSPSELGLSAPVEVLTRGDCVELDGVAWEVISPPQGGWPYGDQNINSLVLLLRHGTFRALLAADLLTRGERALVAEGAEVRAEVLKVAHHGTRHASSPEFLDRVAPQAAVISCPAGELGRPNDWTVSALLKRGIRVYRTDLNGTVVVTVRPGGTWAIRATSDEK